MGYFENCTIADFDLCDAKNSLPMWNEVDAGFYSDNNVFSISNNIVENNAKEIMKGKRCREENSARMLTRKTISEYFYMPISQAARELNVGLTHLKKRCRDLGIQRWPHRKLMSLQTLIKNVQVSYIYIFKLVILHTLCNILINVQNCNLSQLKRM
jgi:hypothetical protein